MAASFEVVLCRFKSYHPNQTILWYIEQSRIPVIYKFDVSNRKSILWSLSDAELRNLLLKSKTFSEILKALGLRCAGGNFKSLKENLKYRKIDYSFIYETSKIERLKKFNLKNKPIDLSKILVENSSFSRNHLKKRLFKDGVLKHECAECGISNQWNNKPISLQLDHINGIYNDNRLENLRILCPNCHSQTESFAGKNKKLSVSYSKKNNFKNCVCGKQITKTSMHCKSCTPKVTKIFWPPPEDIQKMVKEFGYVQTGKKLGVSDNAVRKFLHRNVIKTIHL